MIKITKKEKEEIQVIILKGFTYIIESFLDDINSMPEEIRPTNIKIEIEGPFSFVAETKMM